MKFEEYKTYKNWDSRPEETQTNGITDNEMGSLKNDSIHD